jgi:ParB/RepB/Spo0J family partition protein
MPEGVSKKSILSLSPSMIIADTTYNGRRYHNEDVDDLATQILEEGKLLQPVGVAGPYKDKERKGKYRLVWGFRRFLAMSNIIEGGLADGLPELGAIDARLVSEDPLDDKSAYFTNLVENVKHKSLTAMDQSVALNTLVDEFGLTNADAAAKLGMSASMASQLRPLAKLPATLHRHIADGRISASAAYELSKQPEAEIEAMAERLVAEVKASGKKGVSREAVVEAGRASAEAQAETAGGGTEDAGGVGETETGAGKAGKTAKPPMKPRSVKAGLSFLSIYKLTDIRSEKGTRQKVVEFMEKVFAGVEEKKLKKEFEAILTD